MDKLPLDVRYILTMFFTYLAGYLYAHGWIGDQAGFVSNALGVASALVPVAIWLYARWIRPSLPALDAAKEADKVIAGESPGAIIPTPSGKPDVIVQKAA